MMDPLLTGPLHQSQSDVSISYDDVLGRSFADPGAAVMNSSDILMELYCFVQHSRWRNDETDENQEPPQMTVGDVIDCLKREGILFWRDERFLESQKVALQLCGHKAQLLEEQHSTPKVVVPEELQQTAHSVFLVYKSFIELISPCASLFLKAFSEGFVVPDWVTFITDMEYQFHQTAPNTDGENADYIPILKQADSDKFGLSICSIDGQRWSIGDASAKHSIQSVSKPVTLALGLANEGQDFMRQWIDVEPAGRPFNTQDLDPVTNRPFNSSINSGAIMSAGCFASAFPDETWKQVVDRVRDTWYRLCGKDLEIGFSQETYESEKECAFNNFAIAYNLRGRKGLPRNIDLHKMLDVYLGCCSIEITAEALSVAAATLANGGICPITGKEVFPADVVRSVLAETMVCGMYNQAGTFAVEVGLPAKSGVSGALMVIVPNVFGFATFSPRLNSFGNSVRGVEFCKRLVNSYRVHSFEPLRSGNTGAKIDPRHNGMKEEHLEISRMAWAVQVGDVNACRVRDVFLFSLCQTAAVSPDGLSEEALDAIQESHEQIYQSRADPKLLSEISSKVKRTPQELKFLENLTQGLQITDSMRSLIIMAILDIVMLDGEADDEERDILCRIGPLLGTDKDIVLMELNRYEKHAGHRFQEYRHCSMLENMNMSTMSLDLSSRSNISGWSGARRTGRRRRRSCAARRSSGVGDLPNIVPPSKRLEASLRPNELTRELSRSGSGRNSFAGMRAQLLSSKESLVSSRESFSNSSNVQRNSMSASPS